VKNIYLNQGKHVYLSEYNIIVNREIEKQFHKYEKNRRVEVADQEITEEYLGFRVSKLQQLIFQVTQNCNLRCKYCIYGGSYENERKLSQKRLSFEIARKSMDYLSDIFINRVNKNFVLGFYGGEPTLEFKLIEDIVAYSKKVFPHFDLNYVMTTNMTNLTDEMIHFFVSEDFNLVVSLDGPKENHDEKRVFANGNGSFEIIMDNLKKIKRYAPDYFANNISIELVYSPDLSFTRVYDFFRNNELVKNLRLLLNSVGKYNTSYYTKYPYDNEKVKEQIKKVVKITREKLKNKQDLVPFERSMLRGVRVIKHGLAKKNLSTRANTCLFDDRLFVDSEGNFHVCERINESFPIGNVRDGFDFGKMKKMLKGFVDLIKKECLDCEIRSLCNKCFTAFAGKNRFEIPEGYCEDRKYEIKKNLENFIKISLDEGEIRAYEN